MYAYVRQKFKPHAGFFFLLSFLFFHASVLSFITRSIPNFSGKEKKIYIYIFPVFFRIQLEYRIWIFLVTFSFFFLVKRFFRLSAYFFFNSNFFLIRQAKRKNSNLGVAFILTSRRFPSEYSPRRVAPFFSSRITFLG